MQAELADKNDGLRKCIEQQRFPVKCSMATTQNGNVLFIILIAVALFAALSYAVTQSGRSSGNDTTAEKAAVYAAQIIQQITAVKMAAMRMNVIKVSYGDIQAGAPALSAYPGAGSLNGYADACVSGSTCLFSNEGGGAPVPSFPRPAFTEAMPSSVTWLPHYFEGPQSFQGWNMDGFTPGTGSPSASVEGVGTPANDHLIFVYPLKERICAEINKRLGISGIPNMTGYSHYAGAPGEDAACLRASDYFVLYQVLAPM